MSGILKDFLLASGVKPSDLSEAVRESRAAVRSVAKWSGLLSRGAIHLGGKAKPGSLAHKGTLLAGVVLSQVEEKAGALLGKKGARSK
jgi:hypothetical protein